MPKSLYRNETIKVPFCLQEDIGSYTREILCGLLGRHMFTYSCTKHTSAYVLRDLFKGAGTSGTFYWNFKKFSGMYF